MRSPAGTRSAFAAAAAGALLAMLVTLGVIATPDVSDTLSRTADSLGAWTYVVVPALAFLDYGERLRVPPERIERVEQLFDRLLIGAVVLVFTVRSTGDER